MPSQAFQKWQTDRADELDEIVAAHVSIGGTGRGRRFATQQINHAYAMLLSSQFQGFCRDLHSECIDGLVHVVVPTSMVVIIRNELTLSRKLDKGNPNPGNIGADFNRLGLPFWNEVIAFNSQNEARKVSIEVLNNWRNAIAHQDFDVQRLGGISTLHLSHVRSWRRSCDALALSFDAVMESHLFKTTNIHPW